MKLFFSPLCLRLVLQQSPLRRIKKLLAIYTLELETMISWDIVKAYIDKNHHLPDVPSEAEAIKEGINLGEMNKLLLKKVEELTLHLIKQDRLLKKQQNENIVQNRQLRTLRRMLLTK